MVDLKIEIPQLSIEPEEDKTTLLPKSCYFSDGKTKIDYVIVYPKMEEQIRGEQRQAQIAKFISSIKEKGLLVEQENGKFYKKLIFLKIHAPHKLLTRYAKIFNIGLMCNNPYYKDRESFLFSFLATEVTKPDSESEIYKRAQKSLSGEKPNEITSAERSLIVFRLLQSIKIQFGEDEVDIKRMLRRETFLDNYPIHDGDYQWTETGPLSDRQLLYQYWAIPKYACTLQPIHLIEKYYGPKIAFYFALQGFYTKFLIIPTIIGLFTTFAGILSLFTQVVYIKDEVCESKIILCSDEYLKSACDLMKLAYIIDNPMTIFYVIICACWGAAFWNFWQRRQAILSLRWNVSGVKIDRTMRKEFQENAKTRRSSITGETEYYIPGYRKVLFFIISNFLVMVLLAIFVVIIFLVVQYRFVLRQGIDYDESRFANEVELFSSTIITTFAILILNSCAPLVLKLYTPIIHFLTKLRQPRTQRQFKRMYLHNMFILHFANFFSALFYLAFFKGFFFTYPGDVSNWTLIRSVQLDLCKPSGCLLDLGMQLFSLMVIKTIYQFGFEFVKFLSSPWHKIKIPRGEDSKNLGQWEKDYALSELDDSTLNALYVDLVIQYSFITFFNSALPIIGFIALVHNLLKAQHDAYRFSKYYRRPVIEKVADIEGWNHIMKVITVFGTVSNAFVVAFRTDFILRRLYREKHKTLKGFLNSTLSEFATKDYKVEMIDHNINETQTCFYRGFRYPPNSTFKYQPTPEYWRQIAIRSLFFIILENSTLLLSLILGFTISQIPRKVKVKMEHDLKLLTEAREAKL